MATLAKQYLNQQQKLPPLSMTIKVFKPANNRVTLQDCQMCNNKASPNFCILCGFNFCENCTKKRINNEIVCDYCFLKEYVKKSPLEKQQMFRSLQEATNKMKNQIKQFEANIEKFTNDMIKIEVQQTSQSEKTQDILEMENKIKSLKQKYASRKQGLEERKKKLNEKKGEVEGRADKNQGYEKKLENIRKEITEKQAIQLSKMEEVDKLKLQLEALERERKEVMKDLDR